MIGESSQPSTQCPEPEGFPTVLKVTRENTAATSAVQKSGSPSDVIETCRVTAQRYDAARICVSWQPALLPDLDQTGVPLQPGFPHPTIDQVASGSVPARLSSSWAGALMLKKASVRGLQDREWQLLTELPQQCWQRPASKAS